MNTTPIARVLSENGRFCIFHSYAIKDTLRQRGYRYNPAARAWFKHTVPSKKEIDELSSQLHVRMDESVNKAINTKHTHGLSSSSLANTTCYTVTQLKHRINHLVKKGFHQDVGMSYAVRGEVQNAKIYKNRVFVDMAEASQVLTCCLDNNDEDKSYARGDTVTVHLRHAPSVWRRGNIGLVGESRHTDVHKNETGELMRERQNTWKRLQQASWIKAQQHLPLPATPKHICVITSQHSRAHHDFEHELMSRSYPCRVTVINVSVQGEHMVKSMCDALKQVRHMHHDDDVDVVVLTRGGGSVQDLRGFDNADVVKAVATCPHPVITAIGHHDDESLCDRVSSVRVKTPTAAATWIHTQWHTAFKALQHRLQACVATWQQRLQHMFITYWQDVKPKVDRVTRTALQQWRQTATAKWQRVQSVARGRLTQRRKSFKRIRMRLHTTANAVLQRRQQDYRKIRSRYKTWFTRDMSNLQHTVFADKDGYVLQTNAIAKHDVTPYTCTVLSLAGDKVGQWYLKPVMKPTPPPPPPLSPSHNNIHIS